MKVDLFSLLNMNVMLFRIIVPEIHNFIIAQEWNIGNIFLQFLIILDFLYHCAVAAAERKLTALFLMHSLLIPAKQRRNIHLC